MNAMTPTRRRPLRVAIAGLGAVGLRVAAALDAGIPGCELTAVAARDRPAAARRLQELRHPVPVLDLAELEPQADLLVECASAAVLGSLAPSFLRQGKKVMVLSAGALLAETGLVELARQHHGQIILPTGGLLGLDAVAAAAEGSIRTVRLVTRAPPRALREAPGVASQGIALDGIAAPLRVFEGSVLQAASGFPHLLDVAAALALAGIGAERTGLEIWADPTLSQTSHAITVEADAMQFGMTIAALPDGSSGAARVAALSVAACLRKLAAPLRIGT